MKSIGPVPGREWGDLHDELEVSKDIYLKAGRTCAFRVL
jgi:hypothetical protein